MNEKYFGKYRGIVIDNYDPERCGRLKVLVPDLLGNVAVWAMPCVGYAAPDKGMVFIPENGANAWVEFQEGDINLPICSGYFWEKGQLPKIKDGEDGLPAIKLLKTDNITLVLNDQANTGAITMEINSPAVSHSLSLTMNKEGIILSKDNQRMVVKIANDSIDCINGTQSIQITSDKVSINNGNLEVING
jgi:hypothetical protein